jgi:hypothetical protein
MQEIKKKYCVICNKLITRKWAKKTCCIEHQALSRVISQAKYHNWYYQDVIKPARHAAKHEAKAMPTESK